jgi:hypothetical protein
VLLAYVDESYTPDRYWIVALVCSESDLQPLTAELDAVVARAAASYQGVDPGAELHGQRLFHGKEDWKALHSMVRARIAIYAAAFDAIAKSNARIIVRGVDSQGLARRYTRPRQPHHVVLEHTLERINELATQESQLCLVIADEIKQEDHYRRSLWEWQKYATSGYRSQQLSSIADTLHFAPSKSSRLLQAADLIAFLWCRINARCDKDDRARRANQQLWDLIHGNVHCCWCWYP